MGAALARRLAAKKWNLVLVDQSSELAAIQDLRAELAGLSPQIEIIGGDVRVRDTMTQIRDTAVALGGPDAWVALTGVDHQASVLKPDLTTVREIWNLHLTSLFIGLELIGGAMVHLERPTSIVIGTGTSAYLGVRGQSALAAAYAGQVAAARSAALELRKHNIRVNSLLITAKTALTQNWPNWGGMLPESMSADHAASAACFLADATSHELTGETIGIAGSRLYGVKTTETVGYIGGEAPLLESQYIDHLDTALRNH